MMKRSKMLASSVLVLGLMCASVGIANAEVAAPVAPDSRVPHSSEPSPNLTVEPRIVGGNYASIEEAPYIAQVTNWSKGARCTGELISPTWVLTARHCNGQAGDMSIKLGSAKSDQGVRYQIKRSFEWRGGDLALLELNSPHYGPVATLGKELIPVGASGSIFGFGLISATEPSLGLNTAQVRVAGMISSPEGGVGYHIQGVNGQAWSGDSGGPLVVNGKVVGVASRSESSGQFINSRATYIRIYDANTWIQQATGVRLK